MEAREGWVIANCESMALMFITLPLIRTHCALLGPRVSSSLARVTICWQFDASPCVETGPAIEVAGMTLPANRLLQLRIDLA